MGNTDSHIDTSAAQAYEDYLVSSLFEPWAKRTIERASPQPGESVLDVACGTGIGARLVAASIAPHGSIISSDIDAAMIAVAQSTTSVADLPSDISMQWHTSAGELPLVVAESIDLCLCLQGPQFLNDPQEGLSQMYLALKNGGRLGASVWNEYSTNKGHYAIGQALQSRGVKPASKPFSLGNPDQAKALFESVGFIVVHFNTETLTIPFASTQQFVNSVAAGAPATRHSIAQLEDSEREAFIDDVDSQLAHYKTNGELKLPTSAHIILAIKPG